MYELKRTQQIDDSANMLIQLAHSRPDFVRFNGDNVKCCRCGGLLDVYYCENRTFAVRCKVCKTITLVKAGNPGEALRQVGPINKIDGNTSDGYHTFNELYDHRAKLFSVIVHNYPELCWKSKQHSDGTMYEGMFIVGINTPDGQASYHYDIDPYWEMFDCKELDRAPEWDGHTPQQAIDRIAGLRKERFTGTNTKTLRLTIDQIDNMRHAVGFDPVQMRKGQTKHTVYRNYFATGGPDASWDDLCSKGLAERIEETELNRTFYRVSPLGLKLLQYVFYVTFEVN